MNKERKEMIILNSLQLIDYYYLSYYLIDIVVLVHMYKLCKYKYYATSS